MLFSIIIPVYNRSEFLSGLFRSLLKQTYRPLQIIFVDDGSTDTSLKLCQDFLRKNNSSDYVVKVIESPHLGVCAARNQGVRMAQGKFLYFFDCDDEISPNFLTDVAQVIHANPTTDLVCAPVRLFFENGKSRIRDAIYTSSARDHIVSAMLSTQTMVVRTSFFCRCGGWDESLLRWNDWELGARLLLNAPRTHWITRAYHKIYQHRESITGKSYSHSINELEKSIRAVLKDIEASSCSRSERISLVQAVSFKTIFLSACLYREGNETTALEVYHWALRELSVSHSFLSRFMLSFVYHYARMGGRGSWRIARWLLTM